MSSGQQVSLSLLPFCMLKQQVPISHVRATCSAVILKSQVTGSLGSFLTGSPAEVGNVGS